MSGSSKCVGGIVHADIEVIKNSDTEQGGKDSKPGRKRFRESAGVLCQVIHDWNEEQYWVVPCDGLLLKGGFGGEDKSSLEAALRSDGEPHPPSGSMEGRNVTS